MTEDGNSRGKACRDRSGNIQCVDVHVDCESTRDERLAACLRVCDSHIIDTMDALKACSLVLTLAGATTVAAAAADGLTSNRCGVIIVMTSLYCFVNVLSVWAL